MPIVDAQSLTLSNTCKILKTVIGKNCLFQVFCSELILWRVDPVGPLSKSGGITELARINSQEISAFSDVAWIPTLLPSRYTDPIITVFWSTVAVEILNTLKLMLILIFCSIRIL